MIAELLVSAAVVLAPQSAPVEGLVFAKFYEGTTQGFLRMPIGPPCWGLIVGDALFQRRTCVPRDVWERTPVFSYYPAGA